MIVVEQTLIECIYEKVHDLGRGFELKRHEDGAVAGLALAIFILRAHGHMRLRLEPIVRWDVEAGAGAQVSLINILDLHHLVLDEVLGVRLEQVDRRPQRVKIVKYTRVHVLFEDGRDEAEALTAMDHAYHALLVIELGVPLEAVPEREADALHLQELGNVRRQLKVLVKSFHSVHRRQCVVQEYHLFVWPVLEISNLTRLQPHGLLLLFDFFGFLFNILLLRFFKLIVALFVVIAVVLKRSGHCEESLPLLLGGRREHLRPIFVSYADELLDGHLLVVHLLAIVVVKDELTLRLVFQR